MQHLAAQHLFSLKGLHLSFLENVKPSHLHINPENPDETRLDSPQYLRTVLGKLPKNRLKTELLGWNTKTVYTR